MAKELRRICAFRPVGSVGRCTWYCCAYGACSSFFYGMLRFVFLFVFSFLRFNSHFISIRFLTIPRDSSGNVLRLYHSTAFHARCLVVINENAVHVFVSSFFFVVIRSFRSFRPFIVFDRELKENRCLCLGHGFAIVNYAFCCGEAFKHYFHYCNELKEDLYSCQDVFLLLFFNEGGHLTSSYRTRFVFSLMVRGDAMGSIHRYVNAYFQIRMAFFLKDKSGSWFRRGTKRNAYFWCGRSNLIRTPIRSFTDVSRLFLRR